MNRHVATLGLLVVLGGLMGCSGRSRGTYVTQYPQWDYQHYERLAVLPGRASTPQAVREARLLADRLTTALAQNGAFKVLSRSELKDVFAEQDLSRLADGVDEGTLLPENKIEIAQALVATKITDYRLISERERRAVPRYALNRRGFPLRDRGGRPIVVGLDIRWNYTTGAEVEASVRVIDAATGKILLSHSARVAPRPVTSYNQPAGAGAEELAAEAARELSVEFYKLIAPTRTRVKLKKDMLLVATDYYDGKYDTPKKLPRDQAEFMLVVRDLPEECDRNYFRVAIVPRDGRETLFEQEFVWSGTSGAQGMSFPVPTAALTGAGAEAFTAKVYSGREPEPILTREFELEEVK